MKSSGFFHVVSVAALLFQILLMAFTAWFLPTRLTTKWFGLLVFVMVVSVIWLGAAILLMLVDSYLGTDVPGAGYLLEGFIAGVIGFFVYVSRLARKKG